MVVVLGVMTGLTRTDSPSIHCMEAFLWMWCVYVCMCVCVCVVVGGGAAKARM
jgi:hypothetical protein